ncbi:MAG TPA: serine hydrolase domain-containing protein, partial [Thermoanaerobaculia bacterium]|nr:serine hydrolase domain-containing protein [Thermoanaerobaculia bacterium]
MAEDRKTGSRRRRTPGIPLAILSLIGSVTGQAAAQAPDAATLEREISKAVAEKKLAGLSVGILYGGKVILLKGYGTASAARKEPVTPETSFAIGSVSKQFTCAALLL